MFHGALSIITHVFWLSAVLQLPDSNGQARQPLIPGHPTTVFIFVTVDCPITNGYAPEINRIIADYKNKGIDFDLVYSDKTLTAQEIKQHLSSYGYSCPALLDSHQTLARELRARVTPQIFVIGPDNHPIYTGRIDNWYSDFGRHRPLATVHDLRDVLQAICTGQTVKPRATEAIGCPI